MSETKQEIQKNGPSSIQKYDYGDDAGKGFENQTNADGSMPFVILCQPGTPMVVAGKHDLRAGDFFNTVTEQVWKKENGLLFVPSTTRHKFAKWVPRDEAGGSGGFRGHLEPDDPIVLRAIDESKKFGEYWMTSDDGERLQLRDTFYVFGVICNEDRTPDSMAIIAFWATKIRSYRNWQARLRPYQAKGVPMFAHLTRIMSDLTKNDSGTFYVPTVKSGDPRGMEHSLLSTSDEAYQMAKTCYQLVNTDAAKVDYSKQGQGEAESSDVPF